MTYTFTTIDVPGAVSTLLSGINNGGDIVGSYTIGSDPRLHAFLDSAGTFTTIDPPVAGADDFSARGINNKGQIVGEYHIEVERYGFLYRAGAFTTIDFPGPIHQTFIGGINDRGRIVGTHIISPNSGLLFVDNNGTYTTINTPGIAMPQAVGINNRRQILLMTGPSTGGLLGRNGTFTPIQVPGATSFELSGMNNRGEIVGRYTDATGTHGFVDNQGTFTTIQVPSAISTVVGGINKFGQIVGTYFDSTGKQHGFLGIPSGPDETPPGAPTNLEVQ